jgi:hypothetical protein
VSAQAGARATCPDNKIIIKSIFSNYHTEENFGETPEKFIYWRNVIVRLIIEEPIYELQPL